jgi:hypothetical protein
MLRVMQYASVATFGASLLTLVKVYEYPWWIVLAVFPVLCLTYWADGKLVRGEQSYFNDNNEALQTLIRANKTMTEELTRIKNELARLS